MPDLRAEGAPRSDRVPVNGPNVMDTTARARRAAIWPTLAAVLAILSLSEGSHPALAQETGAAPDRNRLAVVWLLQRQSSDLPEPPEPPTLSATTSGAVSVAWAPPDDTTDLLGYDVEYRAADGGDFRRWPHPHPATAATITGLRAATLYQVRVRARYAFGPGEWSRATSTRTPGASGGGESANAPPVFAGPASFSVAENTTAVGTVMAADPDEEDAVTGYAVVDGADRAQFAIDPGTGELRFDAAPDFERSADANGDNVYVVILEAGAGEGTRARSATQEVTVSVTDVDTEAPARPAAPGVSLLSSTRVTVSWAVPANTGPPVFDYDVRYRRNPGEDFTDGGHDGSDTNATLTASRSGWSFEVQVRASNAEGTGPWSEAGYGSRIALPAGFGIRPWAEDVTDARSMALGPDGTLFVGTRRRGGGRVFALRDEDGDHWAERSVTLARRLNVPNGVAFRDGDLYVAEISRVLRYRDIETRLDSPPEPEVVADTLPADTQHGWKFIRFGPDGDLYVPVGAPCNICSREDPYASIGKLDLTTGAFTVLARGVRNTVGFDWHPATDALWFTDNGRDWMGDERPPDELNRLGADGQHFGYPYCHGSDIQDPDFDDRPCTDFVAPVQHLGPHVAALGMRFYTGDMFPAEYRNQVFMAEHGSWNRSSKIGYRIMLVRLQGNVATSYEPFATGWLVGQSNWGRPVDVLVMPDGALLVSDDQGGVIYRIVYTGGSQPTDGDTP